MWPCEQLVSCKRCLRSAALQAPWTPGSLLRQTEHISPSLLSLMVRGRVQNRVHFCRSAHILCDFWRKISHRHWRPQYFRHSTKQRHIAPAPQKHHHHVPCGLAYFTLGLTLPKNTIFTSRAISELSMALCVFPNAATMLSFKSFFSRTAPSVE